ncbi:MAG: restriction endonuclease subunit S [Acidovorax sp.]|nr:restriction endonuclease subunit S [Acidovorax sp.]
MSSEWDLAHLGELTVNLDTRRKPVKEADRKPGPYPYYGASGIVDYVDGFLFEGEHLLIAEDGENLKTRQTPFAFIADGKFWVNNHAHIVTGNERASTRFLQYALLATDISAYLTGAVMPKLTQGNLKRIEVPCPPINVQNQIVGILGGLDDRITLLRETNATLEAIAQALFKSWFVDFDPVRAKMEGRAPEGMDQATAALFPDALEESELEWVPKGWRMSHLADLTSTHHGSIQTGPFGSQLHASDYVDSGVPVVMPKDIKDRRVMTDSVARVSQENADRLSRHKLIAGDIVFSRRGDVERHALITQREAGWLCGTGCLLLRPGKSWRSSTFLSMALDSAQARTWLVQHAVGATMPNINTGILGSVPVLLPPDALLSAFEDVVSTTELQRSHNSSTAETLSTLRDTLLPRLISGQLRLSDAQVATEAAVGGALEA